MKARNTGAVFAGNKKEGKHEQFKLVIKPNFTPNLL